MSLKANLEIQGLSALQLVELKAALTGFGQDCLTEKSAPSFKGGYHGEPTLATVVIQLTPMVISAIALWLAKQKSRRTEKFIYTKTDGKGGSELIEFQRSSYKEGEVSASSIDSFLKGVFNAEPE